LQRAELIIIVAIALVGGFALLMESWSPETVRITAIVLCSVLLTGFILGYVLRARRRAAEDGAERDDSSPPQP
jgi:hypothetical protein